MMLNSFRNLAFAGVAALALGTTAAAADYVILDSNAEGIEPGIVVDGRADMAIPEGATVVMIDPAGKTLVVEGPYDGPLTEVSSAEGASMSETLGRMTTSRGKDTNVLGAVRSFEVKGGSVTE